MYCNATYVKSEVEIVPGKYPNGRLALRLIDTRDGEPAAIVTVNIPEVQLNDNEIIVKDWSENDGMLDFLIENGLVEDVGKTVSVGFAVANIVRMTDKLKKLTGDHP